MLDVEYLLQRPPLERSVVYRYRTGVLRPRFLAACAEAAANEECELASAVLGLDRVSLFAELVPVYDWAQAKRDKKRKSAFDAELKALAAGGEGPSVHLIPMPKDLSKQPSWPEIEEICCVIDEPIISPATLEPVLRYLEATTDLKQQPKLLAQTGFIESFDILFDRGTVELPELMRAFDERILLSTDLVTGQFDPAPYRRAELARRGRHSPTKKLRDFLRHRDGQALLDLVALYDQRHFDRGDTASAMMKNLYHATRNVLDKPGWTGSSEREQGLSMALWAAMIVAWERRVILASSGPRLTADSFITSLERLGRDFLARDIRDQKADRLAGLWHELYLSLAVIGHDQPMALTRARNMLLLALDRFLMTMMQSQQPRWLAVLSQRVEDAAHALERQDQVAEQEDVD